MKKTLIFGLLLSINAYSCPVESEKIPEILNSKFKSEVEINDLTRDEFLEMSRVTKFHMDPVFAEHGLKLEIHANWDATFQNAMTNRIGDTANIFLSGAYARNKLLTRDGFISVICHEVGHHLGGLPKNERLTWASVEGQADYYSTLKCMRRIFLNDPQNREIAEKIQLPISIMLTCSTQFPNANDYYVCLRSAKASEDYGKFRAGNSRLTLLNGDQSIVEKTNLGYPSDRCRMETKLQGSFCDVSFEQHLSNTQEEEGLCHEKNNHIIGNRPRCWFSPTI